MQYRKLRVGRLYTITVGVFSRSFHLTTWVCVLVPMYMHRWFLDLSAHHTTCTQKSWVAGGFRVIYCFVNLSVYLPTYPWKYAKGLFMSIWA